MTHVTELGLIPRSARIKWIVCSTGGLASLKAHFQGASCFIASSATCIPQFDDFLSLFTFFTLFTHKCWCQMQLNYFCSFKQGLLVSSLCKLWFPGKSVRHFLNYWTLHSFDSVWQILSRFWMGWVLDQPYSELCTDGIWALIWDFARSLKDHHMSF